MLTVKYLLCAESASADMRRNALSAFHITEQVYVPSFPFVIQRLSVLAGVQRTDDELNQVPVSLSLRLGDEPLIQHMMSINFFQQQSTRIVLEIGGIIVNHPGEIRVALSRELQELAFWTITVGQLGGATIQPGSEFQPIAPPVQ